MEHNILDRIISEYDFEIEKENLQMLFRYAALIFEYNRKLNLTGLKSEEDIIRQLLLTSIKPILRLNVPHGTDFIDIGSGAGIPGVPIGIVLRDSSGMLMDSNNKKIRFIRRVLKKLNLRNLQAECIRIEDAGRDTAFREKTTWVFSRAIGNIYMAMELGAPLIKPGGFLFIYTNIRPDVMRNRIEIHMENLGLEIVSDNSDINTSSDGILFKKISETDESYPRRFAILKSKAGKFNKRQGLI